jgi:hypothetical protein
MGTTNLDSLTLSGSLAVDGSTINNGTIADDPLTMSGDVTIDKTLTVTGKITATAGIDDLTINDDLTVAGDLILDGVTVADGYSLVKVAKIALTAPADGTETTTGFTLPTGAIVLDVILNVTAAEATGTTKTLEVGTDSTDSGDADGYFDAVSVAATGLKKAAPTLHGTNGVVDGVQGDLLWAITAGSAADDRGMAIHSPDIASGGKLVTITAGSADWEEFEATLLIVFLVP